MTTDLDRLHKVVTGELRGRGVGRTYASCQYLAGTLETCEPNSCIIWVVPRFSWMSHIRPMLDQVLREHDIMYHWSDSITLVANQCRIKFVPSHDKKAVEHYGVLSNYEVDTYGETDDYS
jgi:hypothetical protein